MRDYAKVTPRFWTGETGRKLRAEPVEVRMIAMYLMTAPGANMTGLYYLPLPLIVHEIGGGIEAPLKPPRRPLQAPSDPLQSPSEGVFSPFEGVVEALRRLEALDFAAYDHDAEVVWVKEMARVQIGDSLKPNDNRRVAVQREYESAPDCLYLSGFFDKYADSYGLKERRIGSREVAEKEDPLSSPFEGPSDPLRSQEQEQEQEQEKEQDPPIAPQGAQGSLPVPLIKPPAQPKNSRARRRASDDDTEASITRILCHWRERSGLDGAAIEGKGSKSRRDRIRARLKDGLSEEQLILVADGLLRDDWLTGRDPRSRPDGYRDVQTVYRDRPQCERLIRLAKAPPTNGTPQGSPPAAIKLPPHRRHIRSDIPVGEVEF